jgi:hypothetical protein
MNQMAFIGDRKNRVRLRRSGSWKIPAAVAWPLLFREWEWEWDENKTKHHGVCF